MDPIILLIVGAVGLAGCVILLLLGLNMLRQERAHKDGATAEAAPSSAGPSGAGPSGAAASIAAPQSAASKPETTQPELAKPAGASSGGTAVGAAFAGVTARFTGGGARGNAHEVLRLLRDNLTGRLMLEIAGKRYASLDEVSEGEMRQALMTTLHDLEAFAGGGAPGGAMGLADVDRQAAAPAATATRQAPAATPAEYRPLPPPSMNPFKQMAVLREINKNPPPPPKSITEQIDDVLQERMIGTPLVHRGLHVKPGPRGDAIFEADGQSYASVDELPDVEVRDVIRAAIAEWESKR
jgi:hypothetical protein